MKKNGNWILPVMMVTGLLMLSNPVLAKDCPRDGSGPDMGMGMGQGEGMGMMHMGKGMGKGNMGLEHKFMHKAHLILSNSTALGLSDSQEKTIQDLKVSTKKYVIQQDAEIELVATDIQSKLTEDKINVGAVNSLVDKKYDLKKSKTKHLVEALAKLKGQLNDEQLKKLKELYQAKN